LNPIINPHGRKLSEEELIEMSNDVVGIIAGTEEISRRIMQNASALKVISRYGIGLDNIDLEAAREFGITVKNTPVAPAQAVAELSVCLMLNLSRRINEMDQKVKSNVWKPVIGNLMSGKTIGIIGLGKIGKKVAMLLEPFNVKIITYELDPDKEFIEQHNIKLVSFEDLIAESDIITLHVPKTSETKNIIGEKELFHIKKNALIINTARGGLIDENALIKALEKNLIGGVAIDAFDVEPYKGRLMEFDNVILTPHVGSYTVETRKEMEIETVNNLINALGEVKVL
jgi:D-3-phosphoglycerate dehydrogenase